MTVKNLIKELLDLDCPLDTEVVVAHQTDDSHWDYQDISFAIWYSDGLVGVVGEKEDEDESTEE